MCQLLKIFLAVLLFLALPAALYAQFIGDSRPPHIESDEVEAAASPLSATTASQEKSRIGARQLLVPATLMVTGTGVHFLAHDLDRAVNRWAQHSWRGQLPERNFDNYIQYAPYVFDLGLGLTGVNAEHGFVDRFLECALSLAVLGVISGSMKELINSPRPNLVNNQSFPSGHTDFVFCGAELMRMEYGWGWGGAAYLFAITVGTMRLYNNWHWWSDVLMGAGLGILCANAGGWLLDPFKRLIGLDREDSVLSGLRVSPGYDTFSRTPTVGLALSF